MEFRQVQTINRSPHAGERLQQGAPLVGLALGAGFMRGAAHVGVIRALERENVPIDIVVGSSAGALAAMMYCAGFSAAAMGAELGRLRPDDLFTPGVGHDGFSDMAPLGPIIDSLIGGARRIEDLPRRFACVATDALTGEAVLLSDGLVAPAVQASMAVLGLIRPVRHSGRLLVDGGAVAPIPVSMTRALGADLVIAVKVDVPRYGRHPPRNPSEALTHGLDMAVNRLGQLELEHADVVIRPEIAHLEQSLGRLPELAAAGERAGAEAVLQIQHLLSGKLRSPAC